MDIQQYQMVRNCLETERRVWVGLKARYYDVESQAYISLRIQEIDAAMRRSHRGDWGGVKEVLEAEMRMLDANLQVLGISPGTIRHQLVTDKIESMRLNKEYASQLLTGLQV